jgi:hypothetical protein
MELKGLSPCSQELTISLHPEPESKLLTSFMFTCSSWSSTLKIEAVCTFRTSAHFCVTSQKFILFLFVLVTSSHVSLKCFSLYFCEMQSQIGTEIMYVVGCGCNSLHLIPSPKNNTILGKYRYVLKFYDLIKFQSPTCTAP